MRAVCVHGTPVRIKCTADHAPRTRSASTGVVLISVEMHSSENYNFFSIRFISIQYKLYCCCVCQLNAVQIAFIRYDSSNILTLIADCSPVAYSYVSCVVWFKTGLGDRPTGLSRFGTHD